MRRQWNSLCGRKDLHSKQSENIREKNHNLVDIEYLGQQQMINLIKRNYWWPGIKSGIKKYIQRCIKCQQNKVQHIEKAGELYLLRVLEGL